MDLAHRQCFFVSLRHSSTVRSNPSSLVEDQLGQQEQGGGGEEEDENKNEIKRETTTTTSDNYCNNSENGASTKDSHQSQPRDELRRQMTSMVSCQCQDHQSTICCFCPHICAVATHCPQAGKLIADALAARHRKEEEGGGGVNQQNLDSLYSTAAATPQNDDNTNNGGLDYFSVLYNF